MTQGRPCFIDGGILEEMLHGVISGMAEAAMPEVWMVCDVEGGMLEGLT